ncbi:baculoviral IAP repeat-containing protein 2-like [Cloeon dipterum]|uniref:baculoviral IAP repeat-containing protein 2-like n=1 Tax=Cloeon dipterum TaxID=197152 RepID=UPI0032206F26
MHLLPRALCDKLKFEFALHRLFSFYSLRSYPEVLPFKAETLARKGLYCVDSSTVRCKFCDFSILIDANLKACVEREHPVCRDESFATDVPIPEHLNLNYEACRLYTVLKREWKFFTPLDLASDGFYYTGKRDLCMCQYCFLEVEGWEDGDTPKNQHQHHNDLCPFLCNKSNVQNVRIGDEEAGCLHDAIGQEYQGSKQMTDAEIADAIAKKV